jgi:hypothetical protein
MRVLGHLHYRTINLIRDLRLGIPFMKPPREKPSETTMRFFSPELYLQFNSSDEDEADRGNEAWEAAIEAYHQHLESLRDQMPSHVRKLVELCLHDWQLLAFHQEIEPLASSPGEPASPSPFWAAVAMVSLQQDARVLSLIYVLWDRMREYPAKGDWPFSKSRKHWLYDEVDVAKGPRGGFLHRVLFSDGSVMEIPFLTVFTYGFPLATSDVDQTSRGIAS